MNIDSRNKPVIGILAGMGPSSTAPFIDLLMTECRRQYGAQDDIDFPKMLICSQPAPFFHDRELDHDAVEAATIEGLQYLENAGASFIAIACNSVHMYFPQLVSSISTPLLNIIESAFDALPEGTRRVAIAASRPMAACGLYQQTAKARGLEVIEPDWQSEIDDLQNMVKQELDVAALKAKWDEFFEHVEGRSVDVVIIACLDLSGIVRYAFSPIPFIDAAQALAARVISEWLARTRINARGTTVESDRGRFLISTDKSQLDITAIHAYLTRSYWAAGISRQLVARSIGMSLCFGVYDESNTQVGFARVVTDYATFAYLCDVYIMEEYRGLNLGKALVAEVVRHPALSRVRRALLVTRDAHSLYQQYQFIPLENPHKFMEIARPSIYAAKSNTLQLDTEP